VDLVLDIHDNWGSRHIQKFEINNIKEEQIRIFFFCQGNRFILGPVAGFSSACGA